MSELEPFFVGRTFDDFLLRPQHSPVTTRRQVDLTMPLVPGLELALPVLGANMDTVVGEEMAKTLALEGGLGFLHRNCSIQAQAGSVRYVKTRHSFVIEHPLMLERTATIGDARQAARKANASSLLVEQGRGTGKLAGILSHRDMPLDRGSDARPVTDFMTPRERLVTRPPTVSMEEAERAMFEHRVEKLPLVDAQDRVRGLVTMRDLKLHKQKPHSAKDERGRLRVGAAIGATGIAGNASSIPLAMNNPGTVYSCPLSCEKWICHRSSRPGEEYSVFITSGCPPLRVPLFMMATRGPSAWTSTSEFDVSCP